MEGNPVENCSRIDALKKKNINLKYVAIFYLLSLRHKKTKKTHAVDLHKTARCTCELLVKIFTYK
jgi:hypothetical protein